MAGDEVWKTDENIPGSCGLWLLWGVSLKSVISKERLTPFSLSHHVTSPSVTVELLDMTACA